MEKKKKQQDNIPYSNKIILLAIGLIFIPTLIWFQLGQPKTGWVFVITTILPSLSFFLCAWLCYKNSWEYLPHRYGPISVGTGKDTVTSAVVMFLLLGIIWVVAVIVKGFGV